MTNEDSALGTKMASNTVKVAPQTNPKRPGIGLSNSSLGIKLALASSPEKVTTYGDLCDNNTSDSDTQVAMMHNSVGNSDLQEVLHQLATMGKKLDILISTVSKLTAAPKSSNEPRTHALKGHLSVKEPLHEMGNVEEECADDNFDTDHGVCLLDIPAADPEKYALACLTALFTDKELAGSCYAQTVQSLPFHGIRLSYWKYKCILCTHLRQLHVCKILLQCSFTECVEKKFGN